MEIKLGDLVQLKSGGPQMVVDSDEGKHVKCKWFVGRDSRMCCEHFNKNSLQHFKTKSAENMLGEELDNSAGLLKAIDEFQVANNILRHDEAILLFQIELLLKQTNKISLIEDLLAQFAEYKGL